MAGVTGVQDIAGKVDGGYDRTLPTKTGVPSVDETPSVSWCEC
jgi:hypothetical protein